jgi:hypothetical protein
MGGTDDPSNLIELTIEEHAEEHRMLFEKYGKEEDRLAWLGLSKQISKVELLIEIRKSESYKQKHKKAVNDPQYKKRMSELFSGKNHPMYGKKHTEESKQKIRQKRKNQIFTSEQIEKRTKKLYKSLQTPDGIFESRQKAAEYYNVDPATLNHRMKTKPTEYYYIKKVKKI